jgi:hypothetical protein
MNLLPLCVLYETCHISMDLLKVVDLRRYLYRLQGVMEVHVETLITSTARNKLPEFFYNFSKSINFFTIF